MYPQSLQKQVEKKKKDAEKKFSSWVFNKFKKNKTQFIRDQDERTIDADRRRRKPSGTRLEAVENAANPSDGQTPLQRQQNYLRAQLLEMKRQSHESLTSSRKRHEDEEEEQPENNEESPEQSEKTDDGDCDAKPAEDPAAPGDNQEEAAAEEIKDEEHVDVVPRRKSTSGDSRHSESGSHRSSLSEEVVGRLTTATLLYEEALHALDEALNPNQVQVRPSQIISNKTRRASTAQKGVFAIPDNEWI
ncbi:hypothetical protein Poli38472_010437 [Pythium oligandrum]|uniref:Uncharacterized protein n=1 Tax=Pythium oligandrum TaxID=41045 RepID=A0A8K1C325_PYTOL|nr:hypothetical protein Poli38472_010437 [Pythium oligandrum]|eukprot:TMW55555.1 hypothetical protein Poli38472_010437 [Pythium oligandrum]